MPSSSARPARTHCQASGSGRVRLASAGALGLVILLSCAGCMSKQDATAQQSNYGISQASQTSASAMRTANPVDSAPPVNCATTNASGASPSSTAGQSLAAHVGAAFGAFDSYIYSPAQAGAFSGAAGGTAATKGTAARAVSFIKSQVGLAVADLAGQPRSDRANRVLAGTAGARQPA